MATRPKFARLAHYSCEWVEASHIFFKNGLRRMSLVWRVRANQFGECRRVRANQVGECRQVWQVLAKPLDECWHMQDSLFYTQITYFMCIKRSSLHSINLPNSPNSLNSRKTCQACLSQVWRVRPIFKKGHFGKYSNSINSLSSGHCLLLTQIFYSTGTIRFGQFGKVNLD